MPTGTSDAGNDDQDAQDDLSEDTAVVSILDDGRITTVYDARARLTGERVHAKDTDAPKFTGGFDSVSQAATAKDLPSHHYDTFTTFT